MRHLAAVLAIALSLYDSSTSCSDAFVIFDTSARPRPRLSGWVQQEEEGEWVWAEDDPNYVAPVISLAQPSATPQLPSGSYKPKQSLGQNYLRDGNTVAKILRAFHKDATLKARKKLQAAGGNINDLLPTSSALLDHIVELGPGAGALTDKLVETYGADKLQCIEIDDRSVGLLMEKHPGLRIMHDDVLQVDYPKLAKEAKQPLVVIGNLPYYITSQILFALADASHLGAVECATVTMQWEVGQRMVAPTCTKDYGILSVVFQLYADVKNHFKIPPTVFYPKPKVDSALLGLHFVGPQVLRQRLGGVDPRDLRRVVTTSFQQRRKTLRNSLKKLARDSCGGDAEAAQALWESSPLPLPRSVCERIEAGDLVCAQQTLPEDWSSKRPEELTPGQFVELTRMFYGPKTEEVMTKEERQSYLLGNKVWRKLSHGSSE